MLGEKIPEYSEWFLIEPPSSRSSQSPADWHTAAGIIRSQKIKAIPFRGLECILFAFFILKEKSFRVRLFSWGFQKMKTTTKIYFMQKKYLQTAQDLPKLKKSHLLNISILWSVFLLHEPGFQAKQKTQKSFLWSITPRV